MSIISSQGHDAFFSYAWDDDDYFDGWVRVFHSELKDKLSAALRSRLANKPSLLQIGDAEPDLFIDYKALKVNGELTYEIQDAVSASEFLFVFIGSRYPSSKWGGLEVDTFVKSQTDRKRSPREIKERIFVVLLEAKVADVSWGRDYLDWFRQDGLYQGFFGIDGGPIPPRLPDSDDTIQPNPKFTNKIRELVDTFVHRLDAAIAKPLPSEQPPSSVIPATAVTIGYSKDHLKHAVQRLEEELGKLGLEVEKLTEKDINGDDEEPLNAKLAKSKVFVQPFDFSKVLMPKTPGGGHLKVQESIVPKEVELLWWNVPADLGGVRKGESQGETRALHTDALDVWLAKARILGVEDMAKLVQDLIGDGPPQRTTTRTVFIESDVDRLAVEPLTRYLRELWCSEFDTQELLPFPIPWSELDSDSEGLLQDCHGVIFVYSSKKSPVSLKEQIKKIEGKLFTVHTDPGRAIAVTPPRTGPIGWPMNFKCELVENRLAMDDRDREILQNFLRAVHKSAEKPVT